MRIAHSVAYKVEFFHWSLYIMAYTVKNLLRIENQATIFDKVKYAYTDFYIIYYINIDVCVC